MIQSLKLISRLFRQHREVNDSAGIYTALLGGFHALPWALETENTVCKDESDWPYIVLIPLSAWDPTCWEHFSGWRFLLREWAREERMSSRSRRYGFLSLLSLRRFEAIPPLLQEQGPMTKRFCMVLDIPPAVAGSQYITGRCWWGLLKNTACRSGLCTYIILFRTGFIEAEKPRAPTTIWLAMTWSLQNIRKKINVK